MDKIVLKFLPECCEDEFKTMCFILCPQNVIETELFLLMFKNASNAYFESILDNSKELLCVATNSVVSTDIKILQKGFRLLNKIIYRIPTNKSVFLDALLARGINAFHSNKFSQARNDFKTYKCFDPDLMTAKGAVLVQILLVISLYLMEHMQEAKLELLELEEALDRWPIKFLFGEQNDLSTFLLYIEKYKPLIMECSYDIEKPEDISFVPLDGYKYNQKIPYASKACEYVSMLDGSSKVYANCAIPAGNIIISEDPHYFQFSAPFLNCELCATYQEQLYTCFNCRYKTYCSIECINMDEEDHKFECYGYKIGLIQSLEVGMLFRCFLTAAIYLSPGFLAHSQIYGPFRNAAKVWNFIEEYSEIDHVYYTVIGEFLSSKPDSKRLTVSQRRQLINTSFRLAVFVYNDTNIIKEFFEQIDLTKDDFIKVIASILLRLNVHITLNSQKNDLNYSEDTSEIYVHPEYKIEPRSRISENAFEYFSVNANTDFVNCYNTLHEGILLSKDKSVPKIENIQTNIHEGSPMSVYVERILIVCIEKVPIQSVFDLFNINHLSSSYIEQCLLKLNSTMRCELILKFAEYFHKYIVDYFCQANIQHQEKTALCVTLARFNHSCTPNLMLSCLDEGQYLGINTMDIELNTELTLNRYSSSILNLTREERSAYFQDLGFTCKCQACTDKTLIKPACDSAGIYCATCNQETEITQDLGKCPFCCVKYTELLLEYTTFISYIKQEIHTHKSNKKANPQELAILYGTYNSYITMHFSEGHETRLTGVLSFVEYLTSNGFLHHATDITVMLHISNNNGNINSQDFYKNFGFKIFDVIRNIMKQYVEYIKYLEPDYPQTLLSFTHKLLKAQRKFYDENGENSDNYETFLENHKQYCQWIKLFKLEKTI